MGMTITEKILAAKAGLETVSPGQIVRVPVDVALANDITAPLAIQEFERAGATKVFDREKVVLVPDHFSPNKDIQSAEQCKVMREFARRHEITNYFELGRMGIEHALLPEAGLVRPGMVIVGADSHTCTYGALGAFATGMGSTDLAAAWITGWTWLKVPPSLKFVFSGTPQPWVGGKDYILAVLGPDRRRRGALLGDGVRRRGDHRARHRRPPDDVQHGHRGGREKRDHRRRRGGGRLPGGAVATSRT